MDKDQEYIKNKFDNDGIKAPESLSEQSIMDLLGGTESSAGSPAFTPAEASPAPARTSSRKRWLALAACALVAVIGAVPVFNAITAPPDTGLVDGELYTFGSYSEIERLVKSVDQSSGRRFYDLGGSDVEMLEDADTATGSDSAPRSNSVQMAESAEPATGAASAKSSPAGSGHSETYLQVEEVDEADIVKTDGKYIYYVNDKEEVIILSADRGKTKKVATIGSSGIENYIHDIYLKGDKLVTIGVVYDEDERSSAAVVYDISDRSKPVEVSDFRQSGNILSSRMIGNIVYLVTSEHVYHGGSVIPKCTSAGEYSRIPISDISCVPQPEQSSYAILSAVDISSGSKDSTRTKAIFGATDNIYCNDTSMYIAATEWNEKSDSLFTRIIKASIDGLDIRFTATNTVRGYINDQFSMDETDGHFRIATTSQRDGMDVNNLFILDGKLKETGKVTGFARNESIRSVRFMGDKAYVITYEAIDPLFIIDLSDPSAPRIEGEVKIDGFSTLLIPIREGRLLGIGHATGDNGYGGEYDSGLKLALFDISDPSEPRVLDSKEFENMTSPAQDTHKALTVNSKDGWYAIPYEVWNEVAGEDILEEDDAEEGEEIDVVAEEEPEYEDEYENGVLVFGAEDKLSIHDQHALGEDYLLRSVYIDDYIYALDSEGDVYSFRYPEE